MLHYSYHYIYKSCCFKIVYRLQQLFRIIKTHPLVCLIAMNNLISCNKLFNCRQKTQQNNCKDKCIFP